MYDTEFTLKRHVLGCYSLQFRLVRHANNCNIMGHLLQWGMAGYTEQAQACARLRKLGRYHREVHI